MVFGYFGGQPKKDREGEREGWVLYTRAASGLQPWVVLFFRRFFLSGLRPHVLYKEDHVL